MSDLDEPGRPEPPVAGDETATLLGSLERQRAIFVWKCGGLDAAGLRAKVGVSSMTLGGMLKHLARFEDDWFSYKLHGRERAAPWNGGGLRTPTPIGSGARPPRTRLTSSMRSGMTPWLAPRCGHRGDGGGRPGRARQVAAWPDGRAPSLRRICST